MPNSPLKVFIFLHWWCRKSWDYTTNKDFLAECQLCCGIPLKPVVSHLWGMDLRSVGLSSRASFFLPWLSMWWELFEQDSVKLLLPACGCHAYRSTAPDGHLISWQVYSCPWRHWKMKAPLPAGLICFYGGTRVRIPAIVSTVLWRKGLENLVMWVVLLPVHLLCFSESSQGCEEGCNTGAAVLDKGHRIMEWFR